MTLDAANFFLVTHVTEYEYSWMKISTMPDEIIKEYNLYDIVRSS